MAPLPVYRLHEGKAPVRVGEEIQLLPPEEADDLIRNGGATPVPWTEFSAHTFRENYEKPLYDSPGQAAILGGLRGATMGGSDVLLSTLGGEAGANLGRKLKEENPGTSLLSELGGAAATMFIPGAPAAALTKAGGAVGARAGTALSRSIAGLGEAAGPVGAGAARAGRAAELLTRGVVEGAGFSAGTAASQLALQEAPVTLGGAAETIKDHLLAGAAFGGGLNLGMAGVAGAGKWALNKVGLGTRARAAQAEAAELRDLIRAKEANRFDEASRLAEELRPLSAEAPATAAKIAELEKSVSARVNEAVRQRLAARGARADDLPDVYGAAKKRLEDLDRLAGEEAAGVSQVAALEKDLIPRQATAEMQREVAALERKLATRAKDLEEAGAAVRGEDTADSVLMLARGRVQKLQAAADEAKTATEQARLALAEAKQNAGAVAKVTPAADVKDEALEILARRPELEGVTGEGRWAAFVAAAERSKDPEVLKRLSPAVDAVAAKGSPIAGVAKLKGEGFQAKTWLQTLGEWERKVGIQPLDDDGIKYVAALARRKKAPLTATASETVAQAAQRKAAEDAVATATEALRAAEIAQARAAQELKAGLPVLLERAGLRPTASTKQAIRELDRQVAAARAAGSDTARLEVLKAQLEDQAKKQTAIADLRNKLPKDTAGRLAERAKLERFVQGAEAAGSEGKELAWARAQRARLQELEKKIEALSQQGPEEQALAERLAKAEQGLKRGKGGLWGAIKATATTVGRRAVAKNAARSIGASGRGPWQGDVRDVAAWEVGRAVAPRMVGALEALFSPGVRAGATEAAKRALGIGKGTVGAVAKGMRPTVLGKGGAALFLSDDEFDSIRKDLESLDPTGYEQTIRAALLHEPESIVDSVVGAHLRQREFLFSKMPVDPAVQAAPDGAPPIPVGPKWKPSRSEREKFGRYVRAATHWKNVVEDLVARRATAESIEALRAVHPEVAEALRTYVVRGLREARAKGVSYGRDEGRMVDLVLGPPYQLQANIGVFQGSFKQQERREPSRGMGRAAITISDNMQTALEQRFGGGK